MPTGLDLTVIFFLMFCAIDSARHGQAGSAVFIIFILILAQYNIEARDHA